MRRLWLHPAAAPGHAAAERLGTAVHARLLDEGDRLAAVSALLAQRYYRHAAAAWTAFGPEGFARWVGLGASLATDEPATREGAAAYFDVPPAVLGGLDTATAWTVIARDVARRSRRLAAVFLERTASTLTAPGAAERLRALADAGLAVHDRDGWRGAFVAQAFFEAAPVTLRALDVPDYRPWAELGLRLGAVPGARDPFAALPPALERLDAPARRAVVALAAALADRLPARAAAVWRGLPATLTALAPEERAGVLAVLAAAAPAAAGEVADIAPVAGAGLRRVPATERLPALARLHALAATHADAAVAALRTLPRLFEEAEPAQVAAWLETGAVLAAENAAAGRAFFALESRTSWKVLRAASTAVRLDETQGVWRKLVHMLTGTAPTLRATDAPTLRPPLPTADAGVPLPGEIAWLATHEDNWRVYRFLALQVAGRGEFGTATVAPADVPPVHEDLFLLAEGVRVQHRVAAAYRGAAADAPDVLRQLLVRWGREREPSRVMILDALLALVVVSDAPRPPWLSAELVRLVRAVLAPLAAPSATAADAQRAADALAGLLGVAERPSDADVEAFLGLVDWDRTGGDEDVAAAEASVPAGGPGAGDRDAPPGADERLPLDAPVDDPGLGGRALTLEELRRLIESGARIGQTEGELDGPGLPVTDLAGKLSADELEALRRVLRGGHPAPAARGRDGRAEGPSWWYDEWDHRIADYRARWCRLTEVTLPGDSGEFFSRTLIDYAALVPEVRRQFQQIRPEQYRVVRGLEDGDDFDLNAVIDARIDVRARRTPSTRLYRARVREARDVATLFLLDMSASTDEPLEAPGGTGPARRIIDAIKAALVVMTEALDELGDAYAIYGFSGQGRAGVEFYPVKGFAERLGAGVKARIGGIEPRRSTRMGTALRHASRKLAAVGARAKHLILLSDGFPQDHDYGDDRRSHVYGIRDTAAALREADAAGITPFCITVDRAGHDYLREMCAPDRYLVIDDVAALPRELPKVYGRVVRA